MIAGLSALELFGAFGTGVSIFLGGMTLGRRLSSGRELKRFNAAKEELQGEKGRAADLEYRLSSLQKVLDEATDVWLRPLSDPVRHLSAIRKSIPIVTVCNFKGGVGKTTLTSLLASYFDLHERKRVLLIDFDFQGSLTDTLLASADLEHLEASSRRLIQAGKSAQDVAAYAIPLHPALSRSKLFSCFYGFNKIENTLTMKWVADDRDDLRLTTHSYLSDEAFQRQYDIILIDAPPRLSMATMNALCASTHIIVPTILDNMSTQAALNTLRVIGDVRENLNPGLEVLGVVPTLVSQRETLVPREREPGSAPGTVARVLEVVSAATRGSR